MEVALKRIAEVVRHTRGCVVSSAVEARSIPEMGVGIVAREHIPKDTLVFKAGQDVWYPFSAEYALETAQQKAPGFLSQLDQLLASNKALREGSSFVPSALVLGVHMLVNFPHAEDPDGLLMAMASVDKPPLDELYVSALPRYVDLPLYWDDRQFKELQGCEEARRAVQHGAILLSGVPTPFGTNNQFVSAEAFFWAISILMSRATSGQNQPFALIPFFDWFNHADNGDECVQEFDPQKGFTVHTTKAYEPGEQIYINYGSHSNLRLLRNYGFTTPNNPYDVVTLPMPIALQQPNPADPAFLQKRGLLQSATGSHSTDIPALRSLRFNHDGQLAPNAEHWLEILLATPEELSEIITQAASQSGAADSTISLALPMSLKHKVHSEVGSLVTARLKQHSSTLEEDDAFLRANDQQMASWLRSCLHIRMGEKQTLENAASKYA